ncbi:MAG: hypothetical protein EP329_03145 [Deltaproteobacteria bacterium]|nr:MAG: hypothetical protein EP329_03145 [Deltaproteobacteria bacterium]
MWQAYLDANLHHAYLAAFVQFLVLGTVGEAVSIMVRARRPHMPFSPAKLALKALGWGVLGVYIKVMFLVATAGVGALVSHGDLPAAFGEARSLPNAVAVSAVLNLLIGPSMILLHRLIDNAIDRALDAKPASWDGLRRSLWTLVWLWIPLHTFTFTQARELRIGIAALLSLLLGLVLGALAGRPAPARAAA